MSSVASLVDWAMTAAELEPRRKPLPWSEAEDAFLRKSLGFVAEDEIGQELGRSATAVHLRWSRDLRLPAPTKTPGYLTAHRTAVLLGMDVHSVLQWIKRGWLPAELLPFRPGRNECRRVKIHDLKRFLVRPESWVMVRPERIRDPKMRRLVELAQERWGDEWLSIGDVEEMHDSTLGLVNKYIHAGRLAGFQWGNWWIRRSDAEAPGMRFLHRSDRLPKTIDWSGEGDGFLLQGRSLGLSAGALGLMAKLVSVMVSHRLAFLRHEGMIPDVIGKFGLRMQYRERDGALWSDWRDEADRFPVVVRGMERYAVGDRLSQVEKDAVRGIMWAAVVWQLGRNHPLERRLRSRGRSSPMREGWLRELEVEMERCGVRWRDADFICVDDGGAAGGTQDVHEAAMVGEVFPTVGEGLAGGAVDPRCVGQAAQGSREEGGADRVDVRAVQGSVGGYAGVRSRGGGRILEQ